MTRLQKFAAAVASLALAGGIVLSAAAFDQVVGKLPVTARDLGEQALKNIARPVHAYAIGEVAAGTRPIVARKRWPVLISGANIPDAGFGQASP